MELLPVNVAEQTIQQRSNVSSNWLSYSGLVILLGLFLIGSLWLFVWQQINNDYDKEIAAASQETMNLAIAYEESVRRIVTDADKDLRLLRQAYERDGIPCFSLIAHSLANDPTKILFSVTDEQGNRVVSSFESGGEVNYADRDYFQIHRGGQTILYTLAGRLSEKQPNNNPLVSAGASASRTDRLVELFLSG